MSHSQLTNLLLVILLVVLVGCDPLHFGTTPPDQSYNFWALIRVPDTLYTISVKGGGWGSGAPYQNLPFVPFKGGQSATNIYVGSLTLPAQGPWQIYLHFQGNGEVDWGNFAPNGSDVVNISVHADSGGAWMADANGIGADVIRQSK